MKKIILFFFLVLISNVNAQKKYHFDYALEFESICYTCEDNSVKKFIHFVNSKKNNFLLSYHKTDSTELHLHFNDFKGILSNSYINYNDFFKAETISNDCSVIRRFNTKELDYKWKYYSFTNEKDTIINEKIYFHYVLKSSKKPKVQRRKKIISYHLIVEKGFDNFLPYLYNLPLYKNWESNKNIIPNGVLYLLYHQDVDGNVIYKARVRQIIKTDKYFVIPNECDYTLEN